MSPCKKSAWAKGSKAQEGWSRGGTRTTRVTESQEAKRVGGSTRSLGGVAPGRAAASRLGPSTRLPAGLLQQLLVRPQRLLLVEGDQGVQRGVGPLLPGDHEAPIIQELHHEVAAAALGSVETRPGLGYPTPLMPSPRRPPRRPRSIVAATCPGSPAGFSSAMWHLVGDESHYASVSPPMTWGHKG